MVDVAPMEDSDDEEAKLRAKRAAILAKHNVKKPEAPVQVVPEPEVDDRFEIEDLGIGKEGFGKGDVITEEQKPTALKEQESGYDIFSDDPQEAEHKTLAVHNAVDENPDDWVDPEGYFVSRSGDLLATKYRVVSTIGKGVFSTVLRVKDTTLPETDPTLYAIKVIRRDPSNTMYNSGKKEIELLKEIGAKDPENRRFCVRLLSHFEHKNHLCMVFPAMEMNLRELVKKYGRGVGISLRAVRSYAKQFFTALRHLFHCGIVHGDIKLDNILVTNDFNRVYVCDFGSADWVVNCEITPYMQSRRWPGL